MSEIKQNSKENISVELDTLGIIAYGKMGSGKTTIILELAYENWKDRIYSNFSIFRNEKQINKTVKSIEDVKRIRFSYTPGVIIIDEAGINVNSKDSRSESNRVMAEVLFLARKLNCSFVWIAQRFESIDINARVLADMILRMRKISRGKHWPLFEVTRQKQNGSKLEMYNIHRIDTIALMKFDRLTYNTLETSKFEDGSQVKIKRKKGRKKGEEGPIEMVEFTD